MSMAAKTLVLMAIFMNLKWDEILQIYIKRVHAQ